MTKQLWKKTKSEKYTVLASYMYTALNFSLENEIKF